MIWPAEAVAHMEDRLRLLIEKTNVDFASWTSFINDVEETSPDDIAKLSSVYESFLSKFPLCYGYWRKYAYHVACLCGADKAVEVYEQAVRAATYSVDMWANYCSFAVQFYEDPEDIRRLYERGLAYVGKDYLCHILWDKYIEFEYSLRNWSNLAHIYIRTLVFPSKKLHCYYKSFKKLIAIWEEETQWQNNDLVPSEVGLTCEVAEPKAYKDSEISEVINSLVHQQVNVLKPDMLKKYILIGEEFYDKSSQLDKKINFFEDAIHRPYFHAKPLDDDQLKNWHSYLDFVEMQGDFDWTVKLYERCLIPCANYQEFWIRYAEHMEARGGREIASFALERASNFFQKEKEEATFHLYCARFKERIGDNFGARASFLLSKSDSSPNSIENVIREANMEKRLGNIEAALLIYEKAILLAEEKKNMQILSLLYFHFAYFTFVITESIVAAREIFVKGIEKVPQSKSLLEGLIQFMIMHGAIGQISSVDSIVANALIPEPEVPQGLSLADQEAISWLFIEFVDLYGTIHEIEKAWDRHRKLFPHLLRPVSLHGIDNIKNATLAKGNNGSIVGRGPSSDIDSQGLDKHLPSPEKNPSFFSSGAENSKFESQEGNAIHMNLVQLKFAEDAEKKCEQEAVQLPGQYNDSADEGPVVTLGLNNSIKDAKLTDQIQDQACFSSLDVISTSAIVSLSMNSTVDDTQKSQATSSENCDAPQPTTLRCKQSENQDLSDNNYTSVLPGSDKARIQSGLSSCTHNESDPGHAITNLGNVQAQTALPTKMQEDKHLQMATSFSGAHPYNITQGANSSQVHAVALTPTSSVSAYDSRCRQQLDSSQLSFSSGVNLQMLNSQGHQSQQPVWPEQIQHYSQEQSQYMIANAQVYQTGSFPCLQPNFQQQGFTPAYQPWGTTQLVPQSQAQLCQHALQSNGQYGYFQNGQAYPPQAWFYYQQHLYDLQLQQQSLQLQQQQQQTNNEQSHQLQQKNPQLQQPHDQELLNVSQKQKQFQQQSTELQNPLKQQQQQIQESHQQPHLQQHCRLQPQNHEQMLCMQKQQQQTNDQLQQLQQQQLLIQQQQQLLLQQQCCQLYLQQNWQEQPQQQHCNQIQITPLEIQALSEKYLQGQAVASENVEVEQPECTCPSSQQLTSPGK